MQRKIFINMFVLSVICVVTTAAIITTFVYRDASTQLMDRTKEEAFLLSSWVDFYGTAYFENQTSDPGGKPEHDGRITLIDADGTVIYDSDLSAQKMDNHASRPEVKTARREGMGIDARVSETLEKRTVYCAVMLSDGSFLRVSKSMDTLFSMMRNMIPTIVAACLIGGLLSLLLSKYRTGKITRPINEINLEHPKSSNVYEELVPLIARMENQNTLIKKQMEELDHKRKELQAITENMNEGLLFLDTDGKIVSVNKKAKAILGTGEYCIGQHIVSVNRSPAISEALKNAADGPQDTYLYLDSRQYQVFINPVNKEKGGWVLFMTDVTEKMESEKMRKEFSANVTHELKTPLTSISGYAEIMKNGLVKQADIQEFSERIYNETKRLMALIDDILKLSRLDENSLALEWKTENVTWMAKEIAERLKTAADAKGVSISVQGDPVTLCCVKPVMDEILYNLMDNAVKYNREQGTVQVCVDQSDDAVFIQVTDTGIGIPKEHQDRIFERFYRVDKSHSKETGGTGLGLSIVKHGVLCHKGEIGIQSKENEGTTILIEIPKNENNLHNES